MSINDMKYWVVIDEKSWRELVGESPIPFEYLYQVEARSTMPRDAVTQWWDRPRSKRRLEQDDRPVMTVEVNEDREAGKDSVYRLFIHPNDINQIPKDDLIELPEDGIVGGSRHIAFKARQIPDCCSYWVYPDDSDEDQVHALRVYNMKAHEYLTYDSMMESQAYEKDPQGYYGYGDETE